MTGWWPSPSWFLEPGRDQAPGVVKRQLEERDLCALLRPCGDVLPTVCFSVGRSIPSCKMTGFRDPAVLFLTPVLASLPSQCPHVRYQGWTCLSLGQKPNPHRLFDGDLKPWQQTTPRPLGCLPPGCWCVMTTSVP